MKSKNSVDLFLSKFFLLEIRKRFPEVVNCYVRTGEFNKRDGYESSVLIETLYNGIPIFTDSLIHSKEPLDYIDILKKENFLIQNFFLSIQKRFDEGHDILETLCNFFQGQANRYYSFNSSGYVPKTHFQKLIDESIENFVNPTSALLKFNSTIKNPTFNQGL